MCKSNTGILLLALVFAVRPIQAQTNTNLYEVWAQAGTLIYQGDLTSNPLGNFRQLQPAWSVGISRQIHTNYALRAMITKGSLAANEALEKSPQWRQYRGLSFNNHLTSIALNVVYTPGGTNPYFNASRWKPYFSGGIAMTHQRVTRQWNAINYSYISPRDPGVVGLGTDTTHTPVTWQCSLPISVGVRYQLSERMALNAELMYHIGFTDYTDGFSYAGNPKRNDNFYGIHTGMVVNLGKNRYACPSFRSTKYRKQ
ncbi:MAG: outer membrane protein [Chitinophagaceae bacterium]|jgi:hypothetical protein